MFTLWWRVFFGVHSQPGLSKQSPENKNIDLMNAVAPNSQLVHQIN